MATSEKVLKVREFLKAKGFNASKVSVRQDPCTYSVEVVATIRSLDVPYAVVKEALDLVHSTRTCEASGESLLGGNTYTDIRYAEGLLEPLVAAREAEIVALAVGEWKVIEHVQVSRENENEYELVYTPKGDGVEAYAVGRFICKAWKAGGAASALVNFLVKGKA